MDHPVPPGWIPASPCTPRCLPTSVDVDGVVDALRVAARLAAVAAVLLAAVAAAPVLPAPIRGRWLRACSRAMLWSAGVRLRVTGAGSLRPVGAGPAGGGDRRELAWRAQEAIARATGVRHGGDPGLRLAA